MLTIRLQRTGTKNKPSFRIVLSQSYRSASKKAIEILGHYNPKRKDFAIKDQERLNYWLGQHVSLSPTVHNLLVEKKMLNEKKVKAWSAPKKEAVAEKQPQASAVTAETAETPAQTANAEPSA